MANQSNAIPAPSDKEHVKKVVASYLAEAEQARRSRMILNRRNWNLYYGHMDWSHKIEGQSAEHLPKIGVAAEQMSAFIRRSLIRFGDFFSVEVPPDSPLTAEQVRKLMRRLIERVCIGRNEYEHIAAIIGDAVKQGLLESMIILKVHGHLMPYREMYAEPGDAIAGLPDKLSYRDHKLWKLRVDTIPGNDYYPDPTGRRLYEIHRVERDLADVWDMVEAGLYDKAEVEKLTESVERNDSQAKRASDRNQNETVTPSFRKRVVLDECWGTLLGPDGRPLEGQTNIVCTVANETHVIREPEPNPFWHQESPFVARPLIRSPDSVWSKAIYDDAGALNIALDELFNLILDGGIAAVWGVRQVRTSMLADPRQVADGIPQGATLLLSDDAPPDQKAVENVVTGSTPIDSLNTLNLVDREFNASALTNDFRLGYLPPRAVKACVPMHSQALTRNGWKFYNQLKIGEEILAHDIDDGENKWTPILKLYKYEDAEVYEYKNRTFSVQCTDDHKWVTRAKWKMHEPEHQFDKFELRSLDSWKTEASLLQAAKSPDGSGVGKLSVWEMMQRSDMPDMVLKMTSDERQSFIIGVLAGEGTISSTKGHGHVCMSQNPGSVLDAFRLACTLEGIATNEYNPHSNTPDRKYVKCHRVSMKHSPYRTVHRLKKKQLEDQPVWCPSTKYGTWVMKQGMTITVTGNTEVLAADQSTASLTDSIGGDIETGIIAPLLRKAWLLILQNADDLASNEVVDAVGVSAAFKLSRMSKAQRYATFANGCRFRVHGLSETLAKAKDFQTYMVFMQSMQSSPMLFESFQRRFSPDKALDSMMKALNINPEDLIMSPEEAAQAADRMAAMQDLMPFMQQTQGSPPAPGPGGSMDEARGAMSQTTTQAGGYQ